MLLILIDIFITVQIRKRTVVQPTQSQRADNTSTQQRNLQLQMLILMLTSIGIFLITTLPIAIYRIVSVREANIISSVYEIVRIWAGLTWFQSLNYAVSTSRAYIFFHVFL